MYNIQLAIYTLTNTHLMPLYIIIIMYNMCYPNLLSYTQPKSNLCSTNSAYSYIEKYMKPKTKPDFHAQYVYYMIIHTCMAYHNIYVYLHTDYSTLNND